MTLQELKYRVLLKLGVCAAGDPVNADDGQTVLLRYQALLALLTEKELATWDSQSAIPPECETPIVAMVAAEAARDFGQAGDQLLQIEGKFGLPTPSVAERQLRQIMATKYVSRPARVEFF